MSIKNSSFISIGSFLKLAKYHIPDYQRPYSWTKSELEDLWMDLEQIVLGENKEHFFGQIVIHKDPEDKVSYIIDGQQRITTATIFFSVIRKRLMALYELSGRENEDLEIDASDITNNFIGRFTTSRDNRILIQCEADKDFFGKYVQSSKVDMEAARKESKKSTASAKRIVDAWDFFNQKFEDLESKSNLLEQKHEMLLNYLEALAEKSNVMFIETDEMNEAFIIFETLNARGKDLETADLLKNHLFRVSNQKISEAKLKWQSMSNSLGKIDATKYIRVYWNAHESFVRDKDLYKTIRMKVSTPADSIVLVNHLDELADFYAALESPMEDSYQPKELRDVLYNLKKLKAKSFYPIMLAMESRGFSDTDKIAVAKAIEVLIVRNFVISGLTANKYEIIFANLARDISKEVITDAKDIVGIISKNTVSDQDFIFNFSNVIVKDKAAIRYLLRKINDNNLQETKVNHDNNEVHIEHIMPQKPEYWDVKEEDHDSYLWRLGNLTLLGEKLNKEAQNSLFEVKKEKYRQSEITLTSDLIKYSDWDITAIATRQKEMAEKALTIWSRNGA